MSEKKQIVCGHCGSSDVRRDATAAWSVEAQDWVICGVFDDGSCEVCEGESRLEEMDHALWQRHADAKYEIEKIEGVEYQIDGEHLPDGMYVGSVHDMDGTFRWAGEPVHTLLEAKDAARKAIVKRKLNDG